MRERKQGELILFPKTIDYYQIELTKLLEKEAYSEAMRLLEFLIECRTEAGRMNQEWSMLLDWLKAEFTGTGTNEVTVADKRSDPSYGEDENDLEGEEELRRRSIIQKASRDQHYAKRLLETLKNASIEKQLMALEQLVYLDEQGIDEAMLSRLHQTPLHPFVSFKLLQTLAKRRISGEATFAKLEEIITVDIEKTPLSFEQFPPQLQEISDRMQQLAEDSDPTLAEFGKATWQEFLMYIYGSGLYRALSETAEEEADVWAAALHAAVAKMVYGIENEAETKERYGITEALEPTWNRAFHSLQDWLGNNAGYNV